MEFDDQTRRRFLRSSGIAATTALTSTVPAAAGGGRSEKQPPHRVLGLALGDEPETLDPIANSSTGASTLTEQLFDGLTTYPDGAPRAELALAKDVEYPDDYRTIRFHLEPAAEFHAGYGPVTADDVIYSFERALQHAYRDPVWRTLDRLRVEHETRTVVVDDEEREVYKPGTLGITAVDDKTVDLSLREPFYKALEVLAFDGYSIIPEGIVDDVEGYDGEMSAEEFGRNPVGAGPFEIASWSDDSLTLEPFEDYHGQQPWVSGIEGKILPDESKLEAVQEGDVDIWRFGDTFDAGRQSIDRVTRWGNVFGTYDLPGTDLTANFQATPGQTSFYFGFNCEHVEQPVRKAVAYVINQEALVERIWSGEMFPATHFTPPTLYPGGAAAYQDHANEYPYGQDQTMLDEARSIMEAAGYDENNRYELTWTTYGSPPLEHLGNYLTDLLQQAHIDFSYEQVGFGRLVEKVRNGHVEAFFLGWVTDWPGAENVLELLYPPKSDTDASDVDTSGFDWDDSGPASERAKAAFERIMAHQKPTDDHQAIREEAFVEMEEANWDGVAAIPLVHGAVRRLWHDWVDPDPFGSTGPENQKLTDVKRRPKRSARGKGDGNQGKGK